MSSFLLILEVFHYTAECKEDAWKLFFKKSLIQQERR